MTTAATTGISLHDVASMLDVHYMTVYKYVKTGELPASQMGRRWVVDPQDVAAFRSEPSTPKPPPTVTTLREMMESGDEAGAWSMLEASGLHLEPLRAQQKLIVPALRETGQRWADGQATIAQEHISTVVAQRLIHRLGTPQRRGRRSGTVLVCCPPEDPHTLATAIFANLVRSEGAEVIDLARVESSAAIIAAAERNEDGVAVAIAVTAPGLIASTSDLVASLRHNPAIRAVLAGGIGIPDETASIAVGSDLYFETPEMAAAGAAAASRT